MIYERNDQLPEIDATASVAESASIVGNVTIGPRCYIDHGVVIASSGPSIEIDDEVIVLAGAVVRSVGGTSRPGFSTHIGAHTLIAPHCTLAGCHIGRNCYVATDVTVLQGAVVGDDSRLGVGAIIHAGTVLPGLARVGMRHIAVPNGGDVVTTADIEQARRLVDAADFFQHSFAASNEDQEALHRDVVTKLLEEVHDWEDRRVP
jgi:carbonic anhydrase/acetyltransferase-like protein (isoleucine patch superfamily)